MRDGDVCADLYAVESGKIPPGNRRLVRTGIAVELPEHHRAKVESRSGTSLKFGVEVGAGTIDENYRGEIGVILFNHGETAFYFKAGERIAQLHIDTYVRAVFQEVESLSDSLRGEAGFGSSGR